jgi:hypothetical protein
MYYFALDIRKNYVGTRFFDIMPHVRKNIAGMLTTITDTGNAENRNLPEVVLFDFSDCYLELVAHPRENGFNDLPFFLQRMAFRQMQRDFTCTYNHEGSIT